MTIVRQEGLKSALNRMREKSRQQWQPFPQVQAFLQDHYPDEWERIRFCRSNARIYADLNEANRYKVVPYSCHEVPFCIGCIQRAEDRRAMGVMSNFSQVTPAGKRMAAIHIVQTAPYGREGQYVTGGDWGREASRDINTFRRIVFDTLVEIYGDGIGAYLTYQDFGEAAFLKCHPHIDLTLNGYAVSEDGEVRVVGEYDLRGRGWRRWDEALRGRATVFRLDAERGNVRVGKRLVGPASVYGSLKYQVRELVDLRKMEYNRREGAVWWRDYRTGHRTRLDLPESMGGLIEYQSRLGHWKGNLHRHLHRGYGILSDVKRRKVAKLIGGEALGHGKRCPCSKCGDWERIGGNHFRRLLGFDQEA